MAFVGQIRWTSQIDDVIPDPPTEISPDRDGPLRGNCLAEACFERLDNAYTVRNDAIARLVRKFGTMIKNKNGPRWRSRAVQLPLGPEKIRTALKWLNTSSIINEEDEFAYVVVSKGTVEIRADPHFNPEMRMEMFLRKFAEEGVLERLHADQVTLTPPGADHSIRLEYGMDPQLVINPWEAKQLLLIDYNGTVSAKIDPRTVKSFRSIDTLEKEWIEKRFKRKIPNAQIMDVEFFTREQKGAAISAISAETFIMKMYAKEMCAGTLERIMCHIVFTEGVTNEKEEIVRNIDKVIKKFSRNLSSFKWDVECSHAFGDEFKVNFDNLDKGKKVLESIMLELSDAPFEIDGSNPTVVPIYQKTMIISRRMRVVFEETIRSYDETLVSLPVNYGERIRVLDKWCRNDSIGEIGVEGWHPEKVSESFATLRNMLEPVVFPGSECPELMFGVGEQYAYSLADAYEDELLVDVDKFQQVIHLFGDKAAAAVEDLRRYRSLKSSIEVRTDIPMHVPFFNDLSHHSGFEEMLIDLQKCQGIKSLKWNRWTREIEYTGTVEAYELLIAALDKASERENYRKKKNGREPAKCPACHDSFSTSMDFFRPECSHVMCRECANLQVLSSFTGEGAHFSVKCIVEECKEPWTPTEILFLLRGGNRRLQELDSSKLRLYMSKAKEKALTQKVGILKPCPTADCVGVRRPANATRVRKCGPCGVRYCSRCLEAVHTGTCKERRTGELLAVYRKEAGENVKDCPICGHGIEKDGGCMHMECVCGAHFCWTCLKTFKSEFDCNEHISGTHPELIPPLVYNQEYFDNDDDDYDDDY